MIYSMKSKDYCTPKIRPEKEKTPENGKKTPKNTLKMMKI